MATEWLFTVLRNNVTYKALEVPADTAPAISWTGSAQIKRTISLACKIDPEINWYNDQLAVTRVRDGASVPWGVFVITTATTSVDEAGTETQSLTGYDLTYLTQQAKLEEPLTLLAGTAYNDAVVGQLLASGVALVEFSPTAAVLPTDHAWEIGTSRYTIITDLLQEISYRDLWFDGSGIAQCEPQRPLEADSTSIRYGPNASVPVRVPMDTDFDYFGTPNVFLELVNNADLGTVMTATAVNTNFDSPLSVPRRGLRIVGIETLDNIASQEALQSRADMRLWQSMLSNEVYTFYSGADYEPEHRYHHGLLLQRSDTGLLQEQDWSIECAPGGQMQHTGKKVYYAVD